MPCDAESHAAYTSIVDVDEDCAQELADRIVAMSHAYNDIASWVAVRHTDTQNVLTDIVLTTFNGQLNVFFNTIASIYGMTPQRNGVIEGAREGIIGVMIADEEDDDA